eukprot:11167770-Lingulodinium_polyedra.AAC.1
MAGDCPRPLHTQANATCESEPTRRAVEGRSRAALAPTMPMARISPKLTRAGRPRPRPRKSQGTWPRRSSAAPARGGRRPAAPRRGPGS